MHPNNNSKHLPQCISEGGVCDFFGAIDSSLYMLFD